MNILLASNSHKDYFSSAEVNYSIESGLTSSDPSHDIESIPIADGGSGTIESIIGYQKGEIVKVNTYDSLFREIDAKVGVFDNGNKTAVIEIAEACGSHLLKTEERNTMIATSYGVGELVKASLNMDCKRIIIGLGGCMSSDGGMGMAQSLGAKFLDRNNKVIKPIRNYGYNVYSIPFIEKVDLSGLDSRIQDVDVIVAADVVTPLLGENGQANTFGMQKGAREGEIDFIEMCLTNWSDILSKTFGQNYNVEFAGAAGGLGAGIAAFLQGRLKLGFDVVCEYTDLLQKLSWSDLVVTGEGSLDKTSLLGKAPMSIAIEARKRGKKVLAVVGLLDNNIKSLRVFDQTIQFGPCDKRKCEARIVESGKKIAKIVQTWSKLH